MNKENKPSTTPPAINPEVGVKIEQEIINEADSELIDEIDSEISIEEIEIEEAYTRSKPKKIPASMKTRDENAFTGGYNSKK